MCQCCLLGQGSQPQIAFKIKERKLSAVKINVQRFGGPSAPSKAGKENKHKASDRTAGDALLSSAQKKRSMFSLKDFPRENLQKFIAKYFDTQNPV